MAPALRELFSRGAAELEKLGVTSPAVEAGMLLEAVSHIQPLELETSSRPATPAETERFDALLRRRAAHEPVQYLVGKAFFHDIEVEVSPAVLIPRPETELLCREAIGIGSRIYRMRQAYGKKAWPVRILDLCTGSGCIAWTLALSVPSAEVIGVDLSEPALEIAKSQAFAEELKAAGASAPELVRADVLDTESDFGRGEFDLNLSNPPYIMDKDKPDLRRNLGFEPESALFVPDDDPLVFYRAIAQWSRRYLTPEGSGLTEINELLGPETVACFKEAGFSAEIIKDFYNKNRFVLYHR